MSRAHVSAALAAALMLGSVNAGATSPPPASPQRTLGYIHKAWGMLTRSMTDCKSLGDSKVNHRPVMYLPADLPMPKALAAVQQRCNVDVRRLPQPIQQLGDFQPTRLKQQGLLYLPHPYVVPGGKFNEMYGWDSYFIMLGLLADQHVDMARGMVENFLFEVRHYGAVLNANRSYYLTRSQPPFLGEMVREVLATPQAFASKVAADRWLAQAYPLLVKDYSTWTRKAHRAGDTGLARYYGYGGQQPVIEMDHHVDYLTGVIKFLIRHPGMDQGYLLKATQHPDAAERAHLAKVSCDVSLTDTCAKAWYRGYRLSARFYEGDRAMRESGFDTTFRFGPYSGSAADIAPVGLNSLLYRYALDLSAFAKRLDKPQQAARWQQAADARKAAINRYLWQPAQGQFTDYNFVTGKASHYAFITTFYPLWAGLASKAQAEAVRDELPLFERAGGLQTSTHDTGAQWDAPFGWAPTNWLAVAGLERYGYIDDAKRVAGKFNATIDRSLAHDGTIREKYNMATGNADVTITAGYTDNVIGFGWTNAVYLKMRQVMQGKVVDTITP
ncbi:alpha,alpha-trehalase [Oleiagrimonas sp. C23AA]|uniref:alpha,alpha-trehalase n=1 Tax=Oleiagrimonas sp. C23AA TaxID=2719047 RepID=UPI001F0EC1A1|nr:alpha,alpha-trehalase [Oleiagrimonas sp. C23AA]